MFPAGCWTWAAARPLCTEPIGQFTTDVQCIDWANSLHGSDYLDKVCDLTGTIPYPDGSFDTILLSDVLEHLPEPMNSGAR